MISSLAAPSSNSSHSPNTEFYSATKRPPDGQNGPQIVGNSECPERFLSLWDSGLWINWVLQVLQNVVPSGND